MRDDRAPIAATVGLLGVLAGLTVVLTGTWWWRVAAVMVITQAVVLVARRVSRLLAPPAGLLALGLSAVWLFLPASTVVGVPTGSTMRSLRAALSLAIAFVAEEQAPVPPPDALTLFVALGFGVLTILVGAVARSSRWGPVVTGAVFATGLASASLVVGVSPPAIAVVLTAAGWLGVAAAQRGIRTRARTTLAVTMGAAAVVGALVAPQVLAADLQPSVTSWGRPPAEVFGRGINPMLRLGENLRRGESVEVLRSITTADEAPYLKVATLVDIDGETWHPVGDGAGLPREEPLGDLRGDVPVEREEIRVAVRALDTTMLPVPYRSDDVRGVLGSWEWHPVGGTVRSRSDTTRDQTYAAAYAEIAPDAGIMRRRSTTMAPGVYERYTHLPSDAPEEIAEVAREHTRGETNSYDRVVALQDWLRGTFAYSESAPVAGGYDGNGLDVVAQFLTEEQSGYCVHFSSALAAMARSLGIPARIAVGYAPGQPAGRTDDGEQVYSTRSDSLHAWTEVWFDGVGWVSFDATPGVGSATSFSEPRRSGADSTAPDIETPGATSTPSAPASELPDAEAGADDASGSGDAGGRGIGIGAGLLLGVLALLPAVIRGLRRSWRWRAGTAEPLWRELTDTAADLGIDLPSRGTVRAQADRLAPLAGDEVGLLMTVVERERYAATAPRLDDDTRRRARVCTRRLTREASLLRRLRARLLPRSLWR